jgi:hypothetical protein
VTIVRFVAALLAYVPLQSFFFWIAIGLVFPQHPERAGVVADVLALGCAGLIVYFWPTKRRAPDGPAPITPRAPGLAFGSRILVCALVAGSIGFTGGFFGPLMFSWGGNLGPLLGILATGPVGFLLGPAIGVASLIRQISRADLRKATLWLAVSGALACGFYAFLSEVPVFGLGLMLITIAVGVALFVHMVRRLEPPKPVVVSGVILLAGAVLMLGLSLFPPVVAPWWGKGPDAGAPLPAFAFVFDPGFDASRHVPRYVIDRPLWGLEMLLVAALVAVGLLLVKILAGSRPSPDASPPAA